MAYQSWYGNIGVNEMLWLTLFSCQINPMDNINESHELSVKLETPTISNYIKQQIMLDKQLETESGQKRKAAYWGIRKQEEPQNVNCLGHPQNYLQQTPCVIIALVCGRRYYSSRLASSGAAHLFPYTTGDDEMCCWWWRRRCSCPRTSFRGSY